MEKAPAGPGTVDITIALRTPNAVHVEERYVFERSATPLELRVITRPCMMIERVRVERDGVALDPVPVGSGPWIILRDTTTSTADPSRLTVRYDVWLGGSRTIPLVHMMSPLAGNVSSGGRGANMVVRFAHDTGQVEFPHMTRQAPNEWAGSYVAIPAFVKVGGFAFPCDRLPPPGDDGGLVWRFSLLLGIMMAWVPLYLFWARRTGDRA